MFPPHMEHCTVCKQYVRMDRTVEECAEEHQCERSHCPLREYFHFKGTPTIVGKKKETPSGEQ
jgi:hypothetical protein